MDTQPKHQLPEAVHMDYALERDAKLDANLAKEKVMSAELANALTIDQRLSPFSRSGLKLCWLIVVTGISKSNLVPVLSAL
jgi:hypothetical protein